MPLSHVKALILGLLIILCGLSSAQAHQVTDELSGVYELKEFSAAGIFSEGEEAEAREFIGHFLTIHGDHVVLPTSELCHIKSREKVTLRNDRETFGTAGGSWSDAGLTQTSPDGYDVTDINFACASDGPFFGMIIQPETQTYLLKFWAVYLIMGQE